MKTIEQRLSNVAGQVTAIVRLVTDKEDCSRVLTQLKAARAGLAAVTREYAKTELQRCAGKRNGSPEKIAKLLDELAS